MSSNISLQSKLPKAKVILAENYTRGLPWNRYLYRWRWTDTHTHTYAREGKGGSNGGEGDDSIGNVV